MTYIYPDTLALRPRLELCGDQRKHLGPALQQTVPGGVIHGCLLFVEAFQEPLLGASVALGLEKAAVDKEQEGLETAGACIFICMLFMIIAVRTLSSEEPREEETA